MKIKTKYHGIKEFDEKEIIIFEKGLPGFEQLHKFIMFPVEENDVFSILHSIENDEIGLVAVSPFYVESEYELKLDNEVIETLKIGSPEEVLVLNTVTLNSKVEDTTANLRAPIIININSKLGEQIILDNEKYMIKHPLFKEV